FSNDELVADECGNFYGVFTTTSSQLPTVTTHCNDYINAHSGFGTDSINYSSCSNNQSNLSDIWSYDIFITKFNSSNEYIWGTYYGKGYYELTPSITLNKNNSLLIAGNINTYYCWFSSFNNVFPFLNAYSQYYNSLGWYSYRNNIFLLRFDQPLFDINISTTLCNGPCTGNAIVFPSGTCHGNPYRYLWSNGDTDSLVTNLCAGNHQVIVTDTVSCMSDTGIINLQPGLNINPVVSYYSCPTNCNGTATAIVPGYTSGVIYEWHVNDTILTNVNKVYTLCPTGDTLIVNVAGCGADTTIFSFNTPPPLQMAFKSIKYSNQYVCPLICNGAAEVEITGGQNAARVWWSNGVTGTLDTLLCPGQNYLVIATDSGCSAAALYVHMPKKVTEYSSIGAYSNNNCDSMFNAYCNLYHTNSTVHYLWQNGDTTNTTQLQYPGSYTCIVWDSCYRDTMTVTLYNLNPYSYLYYQSACGDSCNGSFSLYLNQGFQYPYQIWWSSGDTDLIQLDSICFNAIQWVKFINYCGDTVTANTFYFYQPQSLQVNAYQNPSCNDTCLYRAAVNIYGGAVPYIIHWSNGDNGNNADSLCLNNKYFVTVTDACGNSITDSVIIQHYTTNIYGYATTSTVCPSNCNGTAQVHFYGGLPPYTIWFSTGDSNTNYLDSLCAGTYMAYCVDACGNFDSLPLVIAAVPIFNAILTEIDIPCSQTCNTILSVGITAGTPPYTYHWNTGATTSSISNACHNTNYWCYIDDGTCGSDTLFIHTTPQYIPISDSLVFTDSICPNLCNGHAQVFLSNGQSPYFILWNDGSTSFNRNNICADTFSYYVFDMCNSFQNDTLVIHEIPKISYLPPTVIACAGSCNSSVSLHLSYPGNQYHIAWSNGMIDSTALHHLCAGQYIVKVYSLLCPSDSILDTITIPISLSANIQILDTLTCHNDCDAILKVQLLNGSSLYNINWSNGDTTSVINKLCAGIYSVKVSDSIGCIYADTVTIINPTAIKDSLVFNDSICMNNCNAQAQVFVSNGLPPYSILWNTGATNFVINNLCADTISYSIHDMCNTIINDTFIIESIPTINYLPPIIVPPCGNSCNASISLNIFYPNVFRVKWSTGAIDSLSLHHLCAGQYIVKVYSLICLSDSIIDTILIPNSLSATIQIVDTLTCHDDCDAILRVNITNGVSPIHYSWSNGSNSNTISNLCAGIYSVKVSDSIGCLVNDTVTLLNPKAITIDTFQIHPHCNLPDGQLAISINHAKSPISVLWGNGSTNDTLYAIKTGFYQVTITDVNLCKAVESI
ncbi:MAG: hypothetical protein RIQ33_35, partial [Bacteroidota bacterium]